MKKNILMLLGMLGLGLSAAHAQTLINSWENSIEGWTNLEPAIYTSVGFSTTVGVTAGAYSLQLTVPNGTSPNYNNALAGPASTNLTALLAQTASISVDIDVPTGGSFGYFLQWDLSVVQPGGLGSVSTDGGNYTQSANIGGSKTMTFTIPEQITEAMAAHPLLPTHLVFSIGGGGSGGTINLDNLRANLVPPAQLWVRELFDDINGEVIPTSTPFTNDTSSVGFSVALPWITNPAESGASSTPNNTRLMAFRGKSFDDPEPIFMGLPGSLDGTDGALVQENSGLNYFGTPTFWTAGDFMTRELAPNNDINFQAEGEYWFAMTIGQVQDHQYVGPVDASGAGGIGFADGSDTNGSFVAIGVTGTNVYLGPADGGDPFGTIPAGKSVYISQGTLGQPGNPNSLIYNPANDPSFSAYFPPAVATPQISLTNFTGGPYYVSAFGTNSQGSVNGEGIVVLGHLRTHTNGNATMDAKYYYPTAANAVNNSLDLSTNGITWDCSYAFHFDGIMTKMLLFENGQFPFFIYGFRASTNFADVVGLDRGRIAVAPLANTFDGYPLNMTNLAVEANSLSFASPPANYGTLTYQWYQNGIVIPGATDQFFNIASATNNDPAMPALTDAGTYTSVATDASGTWGSATTAPLVVTVTQLNPPMLANVTMFEDLSTFQVTFNEPNLNGVGATNNYVFNNGIVVTNVTVLGGVSSTLVQIETTTLPLGTRVTLTISGITNVVGGVITTTNDTFWTGLAATGSVSWDGWIDGNNDSDHDYFNTFVPGNPNPTILANMTLSSWEGPSGGISLNAGGGNYFGDRMYGWFIAPVSTNYVFFIACDDGGRLSLSTNSSPANLCVIAAETELLRTFLTSYFSLNWRHGDFGELAGLASSFAAK